MKERLDRAVVSSEWREKFRSPEIEVLTSHRSDHNQIPLSTHSSKSNYGKSKKILRFEVSWTLDVKGGQIIDNCWKRREIGPNRWRKLLDKLGHYSKELSQVESIKKI